MKGKFLPLVVVAAAFFVVESLAWAITAWSVTSLLVTGGISFVGAGAGSHTISPGTSTPGDQVTVQGGTGAGASTGGAARLLGGTSLTGTPGQAYVNGGNRGATYSPTNIGTLGGTTNIGTFGATFGATFDVAGTNITSAADPVNPQDLATKNYIDGKGFTNAFGDQGATLALGNTLHNEDNSGFVPSTAVTGAGGNTTIVSITPPGGANVCVTRAKYLIHRTSDLTSSGYLGRRCNFYKSVGAWTKGQDALDTDYVPTTLPYNGACSTNGTTFSILMDNASAGTVETYWRYMCLP